MEVEVEDLEIFHCMLIKIPLYSLNIPIEFTLNFATNLFISHFFILPHWFSYFQFHLFVFLSLIILILVSFEEITLMQLSLNHIVSFESLFIFLEFVAFLKFDQFLFFIFIEHFLSLFDSDSHWILQLFVFVLSLKCIKIIQPFYYRSAVS